MIAFVVVYFWLVVISFILFLWFISRSPGGYEDEVGFHECSKEDQMDDIKKNH